MKHTLKQVVHYRRDWQDKDDYCLFAFDATNSGMGYVKVCETDVTFETPDDFNPVAAQVEALNAEKKKAIADFNDRVEQINVQLGKLQALTFDAEVSHG